MKWYNEHKTEMIDLDKVSQFKYCAEGLTLIVDGVKVEFEDARATEIYNLLNSNKEVI